jgi:hypothetical protein
MFIIVESFKNKMKRVQEDFKDSKKCSENVTEILNFFYKKIVPNSIPIQVSATCTSLFQIFL